MKLNSRWMLVPSREKVARPLLRARISNTKETPRFFRTRSRITEKVLMVMCRRKWEMDSLYSVSRFSKIARVPEPFSRQMSASFTSSGRVTSRPAKGCSGAQMPTNRSRLNSRCPYVSLGKEPSIRAKSRTLRSISSKRSGCCPPSGTARAPGGGGTAPHTPR